MAASSPSPARVTYDPSFSLEQADWIGFDVDCTLPQAPLAGDGAAWPLPPPPTPGRVRSPERRLLPSGTACRSSPRWCTTCWRSTS